MEDGKAIEREPFCVPFLSVPWNELWNESGFSETEKENTDLVRILVVISTPNELVVWLRTT